MSVAVVIVAAGRGERFGDAHKVLAQLGGQPVLVHAIDAANACPHVAEIVIVAGRHVDAAIREVAAGLGESNPITVVPGGKLRQVSVAAGVRAVRESCDVVLIHDAARPLAGPDLFTACANAVFVHGAAIAATPVADTLKRADASGSIVATIPRTDVWAAQTPQGFRRIELLDAIDRVATSGIEFTDEAAIYEHLGWPVHLVRGSRTNIKITIPNDLLMAEAILAMRPTETRRRA